MLILNNMSYKDVFEKIIISYNEQLRAYINMHILSANKIYNGET